MQQPTDKGRDSNISELDVCYNKTFIPMFDEGAGQGQTHFLVVKRPAFFELSHVATEILMLSFD